MAVLEIAAAAGAIATMTRTVDIMFVEYALHIHTIHTFIHSYAHIIEIFLPHNMASDLFQ